MHCVGLELRLRAGYGETENWKDGLVCLHEMGGLYLHPLILGLTDSLRFFLWLPGYFYLPCRSCVGAAAAFSLRISFVGNGLGDNGCVRDGDVAQNGRLSGHIGN